MDCDCPRCRLVARLPLQREDPVAPLPPETWLVEHPEEWPWWLLGGLVSLIGLLLLSALGAVLVLVGVAIAAVPIVRHQLDDCERVSS
jgi:hypothetical protein